MNAEIEELNKGEGVNPMVFIIGNSLNEISASFVAVNDVLYKFDTVFKAIIVCFKMMHSIGQPYPGKSKHIWIFLEKSCFQIESDIYEEYIAVNSLIADLNNVN